MEIKCMLVHKNTHSMGFLKMVLEKVEGITIVGVADDEFKTLELVSTFFPDLLFIDIDLPEINGLDIAKELSKLQVSPFIVFATSYRDYAVEAFELEVVDYLLKPINERRVLKTIQRVRRKLVQRNGEMHTVLKALKKGNKIFIRYNGEIIFIDVNEIVFIEKDGKKALIYTLNKKYETYEAIGELERKLQAYNFFRSHKSYLINLDKVEKIIPWGTTSCLVKFKNFNKDALINRTKANQFTNSTFSENFKNPK